MGRLSAVIPTTGGIWAISSLARGNKGGKKNVPWAASPFRPPFVRGGEDFQATPGLAAGTSRCFLLYHTPRNDRRQLLLATEFGSKLHDLAEVRQAVGDADVTVDAGAFAAG